MNSRTVCSTQEALLKEEVTAWSEYWTKVHRCVPQKDLDSLREAATGATSALELHTDKCPICKVEK